MFILGQYSLSEALPGDLLHETSVCNLFLFTFLVWMYICFVSFLKIWLLGRLVLCLFCFRWSQRDSSLEDPLHTLIWPLSESTCPLLIALWYAPLPWGGCSDFFPLAMIRMLSFCVFYVLITDISSHCFCSLLLETLLSWVLGIFHSFLKPSDKGLLRQSFCPVYNLWSL